LKPTNSQCVLLKIVPILLVILVSILIVQLPLLVYLLLLMPIYCMCRQCALKLAGVEEASTHTPEFLLPAAPSEGLPPKLHGVFYMRGNPLIDDLMTFENAEWNADLRIATLRVYGSRRFSFQNTFLGMVICLASRFICYRYEFHFDTELKSCSIVPKVLCFTIPSEFFSLNMTDVSKNQDGSLWERWNLGLGKPIKSYWAEKVVDGARQRTPYYAHVTAEVANPCYAIA